MPRRPPARRPQRGGPRSAALRHALASARKSGYTAPLHDPEPPLTAPPQSAARQAAILLAGKVLGTVSEALVPLVIVRLWGKAEVGHVAAAQLTYSATTTILQAGFPEAATYFLPGRPAAERRAITRRLAWVMLQVGGIAAAILLALAGAAALFPASSGWTDGAAFLPWFALMALADLPARMVTNVLVAEGRAGTTAALGVFRATGAALATLGPAVAGGGALSVVIATCAFGTAFAAFSLLVVARHFRRAVASDVPAPHAAHSAPSGEVTVRELVRFSVPFGLTEIASIANAQLDRYLVLGFFAAAVFADYQAGAWQVPMVGSIPHIIGVAFTPQFVVWFREGRGAEVLAAWRRLVARTALLVTPLSAVFVVGAEETMTLLFTEAYVGSATVFRLFSIFMMMRVVSYGNVLLAAGRPELITRASFLAVASNAAITTPCVALLGIEGAALGTTLAFIPTAAYYCYGIGQVTGAPLRRVYPLLAQLRVVAVVAVAALPALAIKRWAPLGPGALLGCEAVALLGTYAALGTALGLIEASDWRVVTDRLRARLRRR